MQDLKTASGFNGGPSVMTPDIETSNVSCNK